MSFRWFVYYGALFGAWAGFVGWWVGRLLRPETLVAPDPSDPNNWRQFMATTVDAGVWAMYLGLLIALALGLVDAFWNSGRVGVAFLRVSTCALVGLVGGLFGGLVGQTLHGLTNLSVFLIFGWTITGILIGTSVGVFDLLAALVTAGAFRGALAKFLKGLVGGLLGGLLGGVALLCLRAGLAGVFYDQTLAKGFEKMDVPYNALKDFWSPAAIGFTIVGLCIGLMVGLTQVLFREAWIRVESGFRAGRELLLSKDESVIGRAEGCDVALFGDAAVDPRHARIVRRDGQFYIEDSGAQGGTFLNDALVAQPTLLKTGDLIRVGRSVLRFGERHKRAAAAPLATAHSGR